MTKLTILLFLLPAVAFGQATSSGLPGLGTPTVIPNYPTVPSTNTVIGNGAGHSTSTGVGNIIVGNGAGAAITVPALGANPQQDVIMGYQACPVMTSARETTCIGYQAGEHYVGNAQGVEDGLSMFVGSLAGWTFPGTGVSDTDVIAIGQKAAYTAGTGSGFDVVVGNHGAASLATILDSVWIGAFTGNPAAITGTSSSDTMMGYRAYFNLSGAAAGNVAIGANVGQSQASSTDDVFIGANVAANASGVTTTQATCVGFQSCYNIGAAPFTTAVGYLALTALTTGSGNVAMGYNALQTINTATQNTAIGTSAFDQLGTGNQSLNTAVGYQAGHTLTTGARNVYVGNQADASSSTESDVVVLGANLTSHGTTTVSIGDANVTQNYITGIQMPTTIYSAAGTALPTCNSSTNKGGRAVVSDATGPTYLGTYTSGGSVYTPVFCNGTNWVTY